jgi:hypothetical protein
MEVPAGTVICNLCAGEGISLLSRRECQVCDGHGFRPDDPKRTLICKICAGGGFSLLSRRMCEKCQGYGKIAPPSFVHLPESKRWTHGWGGQLPKAVRGIPGWMLSVAEVLLFVAAAASGVLWLTASNFNYEAWAALFVILGGGTELLRRRAG